MKNQKKISGIDKVQSKCVCIGGSNINGKREFLLFSCCPDQPPSHKNFENMNSKNHKKLIRSKNNEKTFYFEDDNNSTADFIGETNTFTLELTKNWVRNHIHSDFEKLFPKHWFWKKYIMNMNLKTF